MLPEENKVYTIFDRPKGLRFVGLLQMAFGAVGVLATIGLVVASIIGSTELPGGIGYVYAILVFVGVTLPCLVIGNFVDDLRRNAVIAQIIYSLAAMGLAGFFLFVRGLQYMWTVPLFEFEIVIAIGNLSAFIIIAQAFIVLYLALAWGSAVPPPGAKVIRDRGEARRYEEGLIPLPFTPAVLSSDGMTELSEDESKHVLEIRKEFTEEGMAVLCSNCGGATPLTKVNRNRLQCDYCGVTLGVSSIFVPCNNHPEYLAATTCAVCGDHFCRKCLTAQEPPVDERWAGSTIFMCRKCFEGRYRPAVTTTSFVIPIDKLFSTAGSRFATVGRVYGRFLGAYGSVMKHLWRLPLELLGSLGKSGGGGGGDNCVGALIMIVIIIIAIPILAGVLLLIGAIVIIPFLFYAGLIAVTFEAIKVIRKTDFQSIDSIRNQSIVEKKKPKQKQSKMRPATRSWENDYERIPSEARRKQMEELRQREEERRRRIYESKRQAQSFWGER
ncbi:MAG: hypothetical protein ACFFCT_08870 [Candidatus Odinarchaeota archaeon]